MRFTALTTIAATTLIGLGFASAANATAYTFDVSVSNTPTATIDPFFVGGNPGRVRGFLEALDPVTIAGFQNGDNISINVTVGGGGILLQDTGAPFIGNNEAINFNAFIINGWNQATDNPSNNFEITFDVRRQLSITGYSGDLTATSFDTGWFSSKATAPVLPVSFGGNLTNSTVWLTSFTLTGTFDNIHFINEASGYSLPGAFTANGSALSVLDDTTGVPAPGALALLGLGLFGIGGMRRKAKAA